MADLILFFYYLYNYGDILLVHQVFKNLDFLGWYTTGSGPTENDIGVHKQVSLFCFCFILLVFIVVVVVCF